VATIYALVDSRTPGEYRYIGKTTRTLARRLYFHIYRQPKEMNLYKKRWIEKVQKAGGEIIAVSLEECSDDSQNEREMFWIEACRSGGHRLTNMSDGGEGGRNPCPEVREKIRAALLGKKRPPHVCEALRASAKLRTGALNSNFGKRWTKAQRNHLAAIKRIQYAGSGNPASKISEADAVEIFRLRAVERVPVKVICARFGVCKSSIHNIMSGVTWAHLKLHQQAR
jgi:hypothetical protein